MKLAWRSWTVGKYTVTMTVVLPVRLSAPHHADIAWEPKPDNDPMTDVEEAQYAKGLSEAIKSVMNEDGAITSEPDPIFAHR